MSLYFGTHLQKPFQRTKKHAKEVTSHILRTHSLKDIKAVGKFNDGGTSLVQQVSTLHTDFVVNKSLLLQATLGFLCMLHK
jgi:hypothetical protein